MKPPCARTAAAKVSTTRATAAASDAHSACTGSSAASHWATSCVMKRSGHRVRLELAACDSPVIDLFGHFYGTRMGTDTNYTDVGHPKQLVLPVVKG